ncbi:sensor histidine kinase [Brevibacterium renqingii]|uniref:sensor histidine kinase n=1 Tax=Brevibacterium renqingii TaxID=2776916 RepID=UPI0031B59D1C
MSDHSVPPSASGRESSAPGTVGRGRPAGVRFALSRKIPRGVRIAGSILIGMVLFLFGLLCSAMALTANAWAFSDGVLNDTGIVAVLLLVPVWGSVFLRHRWPWVPFIAGAGLTIAWGDALLLLIALFHLVIRAPKRQVVTASVVGTTLVVLGTVRMCLAPAQHNPFSIFFLPDPAQVTGVEATIPPEDSFLAIGIMTIAACAIGLGISLGVGVLLRRTRRMRAVESLAQRESLRNESLTAELARQSERELLARELHDTLSHRLSVISLHSGALEVGAQADPEVASTASALRQEARASLEDLRHLVGGVRDGNLADLRPGHGQPAPPNSASMRSIPQLIASVQSTGTIIRPSIIIQDVDTCPPALDRAVYRIVQEALTNSMKHAPNSPVTVDVNVSAAGGARISVANPLAQERRFPDAPPRPQFAPDSAARRTSGAAAPVPEPATDLASTGTGSGLEGIRERTDMFGGHASFGVRGEEFLVEAEFPPFAAEA